MKNQEAKTNKLKELIKRWEETGRIAHHFPRKKQVSLNGFRRISEDEALKRLEEFFSKN